MTAPFQRFRHRRVDEATRLAHRDTTVDANDVIWPAFLVAGHAVREPVPAMPGVERLSCDQLIDTLHPSVAAGLKAVLLFGVPSAKGLEQAWSPNGVLQQALPRLRDAFPDLELITDVCLCSFTDNGHCHIGDNDATCELLARIAVSHAHAGAHTVAPSDMMDGRVWHIRRALDAAQHRETAILSYAAKYASNYYGPFRDAAACAPREGDRRSYQMDPGHRTEALEEIAADLDEGASAIIIKPALAYLDIIARARDAFTCPIVAYSVSGEYRMLADAVASGAAAPEIIDETLLAMKRAGADRIITYAAPHLLQRDT